MSASVKPRPSYLCGASCGERGRLFGGDLGAGSAGCLASSQGWGCGLGIFCSSEQHVCLGVSSCLPRRWPSGRPWPSKGWNIAFYIFSSFCNGRKPGTGGLGRRVNFAQLKAGKKQFADSLCLLNIQTFGVLG